MLKVCGGFGYGAGHCAELHGLRVAGRATRGCLGHRAGLQAELHGLWIAGGLPARDALMSSYTLMTQYWFPIVQSFMGFGLQVGCLRRF